MQECSDSKTDWYPQRRVDYRQMAISAANRAYDVIHEDRPYHDGNFERGAWSKERTEGTPFHYRDGVTIAVSTTDEKPDDDFLRAPRVVTDGGTS